MNLGKPVVVSDVGINSNIAGVCGFVERKTEELIEQIKNLL
jgi:hypothetical protein